jgi:hypothetical protein
MRDGGAATRWLGRADGAVSHDERSEELGISSGCHSVDGVDRGESVDVPIGPIAVLERARSRASDCFKIPDVCSVALPVASGASHLFEKQVSEFLLSVEIILICWAIWSVRNDFIFNNEQLDIQAAKRTFKKELSLLNLRAKTKVLITFDLWMQNLL